MEKEFYSLGEETEQIEFKKSTGELKEGVIQDACDAVGCKVEYYGDDYGFTVRFHRHCGEGWEEVVHSRIDNAQPDD